MVLKPKILGWLQKLNYFHQNTTWTLWLSGVFYGNYFIQPHYKKINIK